MSQLVVLKFDKEGTAQQVLGEIGTLQKQNLITLDDAATLSQASNQATRVVSPEVPGPPGAPGPPGVPAISPHASSG